MENIFFLLISFAALYILLLIGNRKMGERYTQHWCVYWSIIWMVGSIYLFFELNPLLYDIEGFQVYAELLFSLLMVGGFALIKLIINEGGRIFRRKQKGGPPLGKWSLAYKKEEKQGVVLKKEWVYPGMFFGYLRWFGLGLFIVTFALKIVEAYNENFPTFSALTAFSVLIILELYWYLQHTRVEAPENMPEAKPKTEIPLDYYNLWEEYQRIWEEKVLVAWYYKAKGYELHPPSKIEILEAQNLVNAGYKLTVNDYHIIEELTKGSDLLIDDVITDKTAPILFTVFMRRLMDGENILVLTAQRCYANSEYHKEIVDWINEWFYKLTSNRDFWKVQIFNKVEDVELASRIIVSSADDILEKNIVSHQWFDQLRTVLFLNGTEIFSESLTSNNIMLSILRDQSPNIQSIVLSNYREALQSSVMRNLDVKKDLSEVRMRHLYPRKTFVICWQLEGDRLFQHKVLSGHIEMFLGAEAVLALLPRREQMKNIELVGQQELPYYEYLEELDNNAGSLMQTPVSPRTLKQKAIQEVGHEQVPFLMKPFDNSFILARDTDFNLVTTLKKWEVYAQDQAFVHVVSPPYLLRPYLADNIEYFINTPIYPLSSRKMISRFETARTLLERMVNDDLSERAILEQLSWISPDARFVKQELHKLFKIAFRIDIVASNYLSIKTVYEFDKAEDRFKNIVKYRLQPRIKDDINLSFLRNVKITDQARNVLQVTSYDLLFQNYLPDQTHAFNGRPFNVRGYDRINRVLRTNHRPPESIVAYRPDLEVTLMKLRPPLTNSHEKEPSNRMKLDLCEGTFEVATKGYFSFKSGISLASNAYNYTRVGEREVPVREYHLGRVAILSMEVEDSFSKEDVLRIMATLSVLLNELMWSLFPETHQYVLIGSPLNELTIKGEFDQLFPTVRVADTRPSLEEKIIQLLIIEDAHQDLGLVQSIFDQWDYILRILDDYLQWLLNGSEATSSPASEDDEQIFRKHRREKLAFLQYGQEDLPDFMDLENTSKLLRSLLGTNHMTSSRADFYKQV